jgi:amino acid adenylation domain-containing protein
VHNIAIAERLRGRIRVAAVRAALTAVARRHEVLRWRIGQPGGAPSVTVSPPAQVELPVDELSAMPPAQRAAALRRLLEREARTPFDLAAGPPWRARLIRLGRGEHVLALTLHHIVFDGWSWGVLYKDLARGYLAAIRGTDGDLGQLRPAFADYVASLARRDPERARRDLTWWTTHLAGAPPVLDLPADRPRPPVHTFRGASRDAQVGTQVTARLRALASAAGATPFAALLAAFGQLLGRLTGQRDLIVGTPLADRRNAAFEPVIGFFIQILPLRLRIRDDTGFTELVRRCRDEVAAALGHADTPLERIVETLGGSRDLARTPLVQVLFNMYNFAEPHLELPGIAAEPLPPGLPGSLFDLTLYVREHHGGLALRAVYNPDLYDAARIDALLAGYVTLLDELTAEPDRPVRQARLRPAGSVLPGWDTALAKWDGPGVIERVRQVVSAHPAAVAVSGPAGTLTYRELADVWARTAAAVKDADAAPGDAVALLAAREPRLPAVLLGVLETGARWAVLDPALPASRLARQLDAVKPRLVIRFSAAGDQPLPLGQVPAVHVDELAGSARPARRAGGPAAAAAGARGYLSLTSGTTGDPKPVITPERPLAHFLDWYPAAFRLGRSDRFALISGLAHDPLLRDALTPLVLGARLCVPEQAWLRDPARLAGWLRAEEITVAHLTPQLARLLTARGHGGAHPVLPSLRLIGLAGDQAMAADMTALRRLAPQARIVNFYGATETPQAQACYEPAAGTAGADGFGGAPDRGQPVPVGQGIDGAQLLVLGPGGGLAGAGELGEVVIRSRHLASGYADAALTRERFAAAPGGDDEVRVFRTGDLGRFLPDGSVVLAGRADDQVKIRGFRVELGEVEAALAAHPDVRAACVTSARENGERLLRAYAVPARPGIHPQDLLAHLRAELPEHAVPPGVTLLATLPLTPNGKVDRQALPPPWPAPGSGPRHEPASRTERLIAAVWREVLGVPRPGATDNFFEIGGHSLALVGVAVRLSSVLGRPVAVVDLFRHPSIRALAAHLDGDGHDPGLDSAARLAARRRQRVRRKTAPHC